METTRQIWRQKAFLVGFSAGCFFGLATMGLEYSSQIGVLMYLLIPGMILSMAASGNVHAFSLPLAAAGNFAWWLLLCWLVGTLIGRLRRKRMGSGGSTL